MEHHPDKPAPDDTALRGAAVKRLLFLQEHDELTAQHIKVVAQAFGRDRRTIQRWIANAAANNGTYTPAGRPRFTLTPQMRDAIARWRGNVTAAYRELTDEHQDGQPPLPSLATFQRAALREISPGRRAGLRDGELARRRYDVAGKRPRHHRNHAWETDHVEASVKVNIAGHPRKPWITWFVDAATCAICGMAVSPQRPSREAVLVALRDAVLRDEAHGPFGGVPTYIRVDGGKEFLCATVEEALGVFGTKLIALPPYDPEGKPRVEAVNGAVKKTLFAGLPGYTHAPTLPGGKPVDPDQPLLPLEAFIALLLNWVHWWNFDHPIKTLNGRTPAQAWNDDLTPINDIDPQALHTYTLERHGKPLTINNHGVRWRRRDYIADWMHGHVGQKVHLRYLPHHDHRIELYDPATGRHLGAAHMAEQATPDQIRALQRARRREADRLRTELQRAERERNIRFAAATDPTPPQPLDALPEHEAQQRLRELGGHDAHGLSLPDFIPLPEPDDGWTLPLDAPLTDHTPSNDKDTP